MSKELKAVGQLASIATYAFRLRSYDLAQYYRTDTHVFEAYNGANVANYRIAATNTPAGSNEYVGDMPTTGTPASTYFQELVDVGNVQLSYPEPVNWDGVAEVSLTSFLPTAVYIARASLSNNVYQIVMTVNGVEIASGITNPLMTVHADDDTVLINAVTLTQVTGGQYKFAASGAQLASLGQSVFASISITHNGSTRNLPANALVSQ